MDLSKEELNEMLTAFKSEITETFTSQTKEMLAQVDKKNSGTAASLTKEFQKTASELRNQMFNGSEDSSATAPESAPQASPAAAPAQTSGEKLSLKALQSQIETLKQERIDQAQKLQESQRNVALNNMFSSKNSQFPDKATRAFLMENEANLKQEDGNWYLTDGESVKPLNDAVDSFLNTDFGQTFQPASKGRGLGLKPVKGEQSAGVADTMTLNEALLTPNPE